MAKVMSGRVFVRNISLPMMVLKMVGSMGCVFVSLQIVKPAGRGVWVGLQSVSPESSMIVCAKSDCVIWESVETEGPGILSKGQDRTCGIAPVV
jgi:hypothetical protein